MKVLSFIIPAYNSEKFLDKCIPSMLVEGLLSKLEIIVVNDGSKDNTKALAESYCARYPDTVRLISQENRGHGGALNTGCAAATGKYLKVIDADDWVVSENIPQFISKLEICECDVVLTHYHTINISTGEVKSWKNSPKAFEAPYTFETMMSDWDSYKHNMVFHGITYRTDFYKEIGHRLAEHVFYEDHEYATYPCCYAKSICSFDLFLYEYRIGDVNQSVSNSNQLKRIGHLETVLCQMMSAYNALPQSAGKAYAAMKIKGVILSYLTTALLVNPDKREGRRLARNCMKECRESAPEAYFLAKRKYKVFLAMNLLHISKATWDKLVNSRLYQKI